MRIAVVVDKEWHVEMWMRWEREWGKGAKGRRPRSGEGAGRVRGGTLGVNMV